MEEQEKGAEEMGVEGGRPIRLKTTQRLLSFVLFLGW
jgi:hypothetical protein